MERELILRALEETGGNVTQAAQRLKKSARACRTRWRISVCGIASSHATSQRVWR